MAGRKPRVPMQVAPEFEMRVKKLQEEIRKKQGKNVSLRDLTERIAKVPSFEDLEKAILKIGSAEITIKFDRRTA